MSSLPGLAALARLVRRHSVRTHGRCGCPLCNRTERQARTAISMPRKHPERITRALPAAHEEYLAALADQLWPCEEYDEIITELRREEGQS